MLVQLDGVDESRPAEPVIDDDEDTLSGLDAVPAVDTAVIPVAEIEAHMQAQAEEETETDEHGRRLLPLLLLLFVLVAIAVLAVWGLTR